MACVLVCPYCTCSQNYCLSILLRSSLYTFTFPKQRSLINVKVANKSEWLVVFPVPNVELSVLQDSSRFEIHLLCAIQFISDPNQSFENVLGFWGSICLVFA